jgi:hypothetical protein
MAIRSSGDTLDAYRTTSVGVQQSQSDVRDLLRARKATGMQISESWLEEDAVADVRFGMPGEAGGYYAYRIRVRVPKLDPEAHRVRINQLAASRRRGQANMQAQRRAVELTTAAAKTRPGPGRTFKRTPEQRERMRVAMRDSWARRKAATA